MAALADGVVHDIVSIILSHRAAASIILFGSRARGDAWIGMLRGLEEVALRSLRE